MITQAQLYALDSTGLVIARNVIDKSQIIIANKFIDEFVGNENVGKFPVMEIDELFFQFMEHPWVLAACEKILGPHFRFDHSFGLQQPGRGVNPNLHGGPLTCLGSNYYVSNGSIIRCGRVSVSIPLTYQDKNTGGYVFIPGSHKSSFLYTGKQILEEILPDKFESDCIICPLLNPGDICFFVDGLVHGTSDWRLNGKRRALYYMYSPGFVSWRPYGQIEKYLSKATTESQKKLLRPPYVAEFRDEDVFLGNNEWREPTV